MAPEQVRFLPVTDRAVDYCKEQAAKLTAQGYRVTVDTRSEKIGKKIRDAQMEKIPYMLVVGDRDIEAGTVSPRNRTEGDLGAMTLEAFTAVAQGRCGQQAQEVIQDSEQAQWDHLLCLFLYHFDFMRTSLASPRGRAGDGSFFCIKTALPEHRQGCLL